MNYMLTIYLATQKNQSIIFILLYLNVKIQYEFIIEVLKNLLIIEKNSIL